MMGGNKEEEKADLVNQKLYQCPGESTYVMY